MKQEATIAFSPSVSYWAYRSSTTATCPKRASSERQQRVLREDGHEWSVSRASVQRLEGSTADGYIHMYLVEVQYHHEPDQTLSMNDIIITRGYIHEQTEQ